MLFFDRLILAKYSTVAMTAAVTAGTVCFVFNNGSIAIASIAEVFVGQYNGAKREKEAGKPVWQMIWFSLLTVVLYLPCALYAGDYLFANYEHGAKAQDYFQTLLFFGPVFPIVATLSSFFVGIGKVKFVTSVTIFANAINIGLDLILIFGISGWILPMGTKGAALATGISQVIQAGILLSLFLSHYYRTHYGTALLNYDSRLFWKCLRIGCPNAFAFMIEVGGWSLVMLLLATKGQTHLTVISVAHTLRILFAFAVQGIEKGVITISSNYMGANRYDIIPKMFNSSLKMLVGICVLFAIPLLIYPDFLINHFLSPEYSGIEREQMFLYIRYACFWMWLYFFFDTLSWTIAGILTAAGDTAFVMIINGVSVWLFAILPIYLFVIATDGSPVLPWVITSFYGFMNMLFFLMRYRTNRWMNSCILSQTPKYSTS